LLGDLRARGVSGGIVTGLAQGSKFSLSLISAIVLARLLMPEDFGLVAMVTTITGFLRVFKDAGLSTVTIQKVNITHAQVSNLFWINVAVSATLSLIVAALAPVVAWFYRDPRLVAVTLALASTFAVSGAVVQHQALLNRQLRFKAIAVIDVSSAALGLLVGIAMACLNLKYWSLVGMQLSTVMVELTLTLWISRWRPQRPTRSSGTWSLLHFGAHLTVASVFRRLAGGCDTLFLGRWYGAYTVGLYTRGASLFIRPIEQLTGPFEAVFTPILSHLQGDLGRYRRTFLQAYGAVVLLWFPVTALLMALSRPLVLVLLGTKWEQVIPVFGWFTVAGLFLPLYCMVMLLLNTQGRGKDIMITGLIFSVTTVGSILAGLPFGAVGVAAAFSCVGLLVRLPVQYYIVGRRGPVSTADLWSVPLRYLPNWGLVFGAAYLTLKVLPPNCPPILQLCLCAPAGVTAGILMTLAVPSQRREALRVWELLKPLATRLRRRQ
jgi:O-antigen/teichoic acid export membrane protein